VSNPPEPTRPIAATPALLRSYLARAVPAGVPAPRQVLITQTGEMFRKVGARALRFSATERLAVDRVAFAWQARFPIAPLVSFGVLDQYANGSGTLQVRALGLPLQTQTGPDVDVGEAYRYLAELPWVPHAIASNHELKWRELDRRTIEVATPLGDQRPAVRIEFDASGDIVGSAADARPRDVNGSAVPTPWRGEFSDYATLGGIRMPTRAEVYWDLPEKRFVYWRGEITSAQALDEPFVPA
jgi:hypothetical protein